MRHWPDWSEDNSAPSEMLALDYGTLDNYARLAQGIEEKSWFYDSFRTFSLILKIYSFIHQQKASGDSQQWMLKTGKKSRYLVRLEVS